MKNRTFNNLKSSHESKPKKQIFHIGSHILCILDKRIVEKLGITENDICTQTIAEDGSITLRITRFSKGGRDFGT